MSALSLSRTCNLRDFPEAISVAAWQQALAVATWQRWLLAFHRRTREAPLVVNYSGCQFEAPGPTGIYRYPGESTDGLQRLPAIWALCVIDHIEAPLAFLHQAAEHLSADGLLFLTFAFWAAEGEDKASGSETRARIYDAKAQKKLMFEVRPWGLTPFGGVDWTYYGNRLGGDHTLASLVFTRRIEGRT